MSFLMLKIDNLIEGCVIKRPSVYITPFYISNADFYKLIFL